jgi:P-type Ca2+ transporter type 2C
MINLYNQEISEILSHFNTAEANGLSAEEAKRRLEEYGFNQLTSKRKKTFFRMFIAQFKSFMIIILLVLFRNERQKLRSKL